MLYGSKAWQLRENKMTIFRRTKKAMVRAMAAVKLIEKRSNEELAYLLGLEETLDRLAKVNAVL